MANHVGQSTKIKDSQGRVWTISRQERRHAKQFEEWAKSRIKDPRAVAKDATLDLAKEEVKIRKDASLAADEKEAMVFALRQQQAVYSKSALELASGELSMEHPLVKALAATTDGMSEITRILLADHHPDVTWDDAFALLNDVGQEVIAEAFAKAQGEAPKAEAPASPG